MICEKFDERLRKDIKEFAESNNYNDWNFNNKLLICGVRRAGCSHSSWCLVGYYYCVSQEASSCYQLLQTYRMILLLLLRVLTCGYLYSITHYSSWILNQKQLLLVSEIYMSWKKQQIADVAESLHADCQQQPAIQHEEECAVNQARGSMYLVINVEEAISRLKYVPHSLKNYPVLSYSPPVEVSLCSWKNLDETSSNIQKQSNHAHFDLQKEAPSQPLLLRSGSTHSQQQYHE